MPYSSSPGSKNGAALSSLFIDLGAVVGMFFRKRVMLSRVVVFKVMSIGACSEEPPPDSIPNQEGSQLIQKFNLRVDLGAWLRLSACLFTAAGH